VADLYLTRQPTLHEHGWKFLKMLRELGVPLHERAAAVRACIVHYLRLIGERLLEPDEGARRLLDLRNRVERRDLQRSAAGLQDLFAHLRSIEQLYYEYDEPWDDFEPIAERRRRGDPAILRLDDQVRASQRKLHAPTIDPGWLESNGGNVRKIAEAIQAESDFTRLPILADALDEAGCTNADILEHCRFPDRHKNACWVIGLLLDPA